VRFSLNGKTVDIRAHPMRRLLDVLREDCGLTGTKEGCGEGECGACTVLLDGQAVNACLVPFAQVKGRRVVTIEGLKGRQRLKAAFVSEGGTQCGICTPGVIMATSALPPRATPEEVRTGLAVTSAAAPGTWGSTGRSRRRQGGKAERRGRGAEGRGRRRKAEGGGGRRRAEGGRRRAQGGRREAQGGLVDLSDQCRMRTVISNMSSSNRDRSATALALNARGTGRPAGRLHGTCTSRSTRARGRGRGS